MNAYQINEIFHSLQGEGFYTGTPAVFLRFSGCNLNCDFCDTDHSASRPMSVDSIIEAIENYPTRHIVITGGEPSLQLDDTLVNALHRVGWYIQVETNGTNQLPESIDWVTCSPKNGTNILQNRIDELKIVYTGQEVETIAEALPATHLFLQPCSGVNTDAVINYILAHPWWRLSLQTHRLLNIP